MLWKHTDERRRALKISVFISVLSVFIGVSQIGFCQPVVAQEDKSLRFERTDGARGPFEDHFEVTRHGIRRKAMRLIAPVAVRAPLEVATAGAELEFLAAPVFNVGDGMLLHVLLAGESGEEMLYTRYFDSGRKAADRQWVQIKVPLPLRPGARWLVLRVSGGPQGNFEADWLAIASMNLSRKTP
jgi:hypothetical protein